MADNLEELNTPQDKPKNAPVNTVAPEQQAPATEPTGALNEKYQQFVADNANNINAMYDAQQQSQLTGLESAYTQNLSDATAQKDAIDKEYNRMANDLAVQYERQRRNQNLQAQLNGLNVGTGSQMDLALGSEYNRDFGDLRGRQAAAQVEQDRQISNIEAQYRLAVQQAIADNDLARAAALVDEANNKVSQLTHAYQLQQEDMGNAAALLASAGDFSGYQNMLGLTDDQTGLLQTQWIVQNPDLAWNSGMVTAEQYKAITGKNPPNAGGRSGAALNTYMLNQIINAWNSSGGNKSDPAYQQAMKDYTDAFLHGDPSNLSSSEANYLIGAGVPLKGNG